MVDTVRRPGRSRSTDTGRSRDTGRPTGTVCKVRQLFAHKAISWCVLNFARQEHLGGLLGQPRSRPGVRHVECDDRVGCFDDCLCGEQIEI